MHLNIIYITALDFPLISFGQKQAILYLYFLLSKNILKFIIILIILVERMS